MRDLRRQRVRVVTSSYRQVKREAAALLRAASVYVRRGWVRKTNARNAEGLQVDPEGNEAVCWCAQGAMSAAMRHLGLRHPFLFDDDPTMNVAKADDIIGRRVAITEVARMALRWAVDLDPDLTIPNWNDDLVEDAEEVATAMIAGAEYLEVAA